MRALILLAHPEPRSFNAHLATQAAEQLRRDGMQVEVVDLYAEGFDPWKPPTTILSACSATLRCPARTTPQRRA
jgi:putative NADPH-quinone reductase